ncbi:MAG: YjgP/YjgQ family permease [Calditrichaeota bacterium]|nr:MAG: YjgP/YjgQ family permease [Calditrichota bacterium]
MTLLDRYIVRKFLGILFYANFAFIAIFVVVDLIEHLDKILANHGTFHDVVLYYVYYLPYIVVLTLPVNMLLSSLFTMGMMAQANEIIACQSAGISLYRLLTPLLALALLISIASGVAAETVVPSANRARLDIWRYKIKKETRRIHSARTELALQDGENRQVFIQLYNSEKKIANRVSILWIESNRVVRRWDAQIMEWKEDRGQWLLRMVTIRQFLPEGELVQQRDSLWYTDSHIVHEDLVDLEIKPEEMNYAELKRFVDKMLALGADARRWLVDLYFKISYPFANFIIVLFGAPLASRKRRSGPAFGFAMALLISFIYFIFLRTGQVLGHKGDLEPWLAAWIGNLVFGFAGLVTLLKVRK